MAHVRRNPRTWTMEQARVWRETYEADQTLTVKALAQRVGRVAPVVGDALITAGATIRTPRQLGIPKTRKPNRDNDTGQQE